MYGLYFFEDADNGNTRTVTIEAYINMFDNVMSVNTNPDIWYKQDGAVDFTHSFSGNGMAKKSLRGKT